MKLFKHIISLILSNTKKEENNEQNNNLIKKAIYFAHFYWRLRGNPQNALNCLFNYLLMEKDNIPARFQLGIIQLRLGNYKRAIEHLEFINNKVPNCAKCLLPLGDAYVLDGNFSEAIDTFDKALRLETDLDLALTKVSLLRCINKIFEVMENQHENLLDTIKDVEMFKEKMRRIYQLEELIESNRAPVEARLQAKLAYEHFEYGALPFANCREGIQWNGGRRERKRLFCTVNNWKLYNESLNKQREKVKAEIELIINQQFEASPELKFVELDRLKRKANDEIREEKRLSEWKEYISKLAPFIGIGLEMDEPQLIPKYPILDKFPIFLIRLGHLFTNVKKLLILVHYLLKLLSMTLSLHNCLSHRKIRDLCGVSDLLTKYLAIKDGELTPLPWKLPSCTLYNDTGFLLNEKLKFIENLNSFQKLKFGYFTPSDEFSEHKLKNEIFRLAGYNLDNDWNGKTQQPLIREIGQRIGNLLKFNIGPRWLTFNLAALYFRYLGIPGEAINCIELALKYSKYEDIALTQLVQIILLTNYSITDQNELNGLERILSIAMNSGVNEPIPYHLMAIFYQLKGNLHTSEKLLFQTLELDPKFKPSLNMLLFKKCSKRIINYSKPKLSIKQIYFPLCCWPNEQEIFCFKQLTTKNKKKTINCYRPEPLLESPLFNIKLIYFRCNTPYIGKSYLAPAFARFIIPLLFPAAKLREIKEDIFAKKLEAELAHQVVDRHKIEETPVFPLDYGGYSLNRIRAHQRPIWPEGVKEQINQFQIDFKPSINNENIFGGQNEFKLTKEIKLERTTIDETIFNEYLKNEWTENNEKKNKGDKKKQTKQQNNVKMTKEKSKVSESIVVDGVTSSFLNNQSKRLKSSRVQIDGTLLGTLSNRGEVLFKLDIPLPEILPVPPSLMVNKGKQFALPFKRDSLREICQTQKKLNHLFEQPVSTWVSPSAKGIKVDDLLNFGELPELADLLLEPECPEPTLVLQSSSILLELDELPAYLYREHLTKFYKPEKALRDIVLRELPLNYFFALKGAAMHPSVSSSKPISSIREFVLGTISSLYWRIKGDPLNSIKCLRHSLYNSPNEFIDVPLVSLANIYHQAGFLHSALYTLGKGKNVVAVHFTLANVYSTIGDFPHALQFYYSTLSLQSNFEPAKASITAIHCLTNGVLLND
uniref:Uncharacterized protein n=1 Tax=Meloidogyne enterolobii TaxID=390850 RepID=A0A6V7U4D4_MELEN|nr:unnamed protein product [Meloidogyne enterolobii]